jgi:uncharacterized protein (TIGR03066 family)
MRRTFATTTVLLAIAVSMSSGQEATTNKLIGTWVRVKGGGGTPGSSMELAKDGKIICRPIFDGKQAKFEGTYAVKGDAITIVMKIDGREGKEVYKIGKLTPTELHIAYPNGIVEEYKRK